MALLMGQAGALHGSWQPPCSRCPPDDAVPTGQEARLAVSTGAGGAARPCGDAGTAGLHGRRPPSGEC